MESSSLVTGHLPWSCNGTAATTWISAETIFRIKNCGTEIWDEATDLNVALDEPPLEEEPRLLGHHRLVRHLAGDYGEAYSGRVSSRGDGSDKIGLGARGGEGTLLAQIIAAGGRGRRTAGAGRERGAATESPADGEPLGGKAGSGAGGGAEAGGFGGGAERKVFAARVLIRVEWEILSSCVLVRFSPP